MSRLRLDLIVRKYPRAVPGSMKHAVIEPGLISATYERDKPVDRWSWRLWSGSRIVSTSGPQLYSRRIDCARGAEVGAGLFEVRRAIEHGHMEAGRLVMGGDFDPVDVRLIDERGATA